MEAQTAPGFCVSKETILTKAEKLNFDLNEDGIFFSGNHTPGSRIQNIVKEGDDVTLKKGELNVHVLDVRQNPDNTYIGTVDFVEPYEALLAEGVKEGSEMTFLYDHIFACRYN